MVKGANTLERKIIKGEKWWHIAPYVNIQRNRFYIAFQSASLCFELEVSSFGDRKCLLTFFLDEAVFLPAPSNIAFLWVPLAAGSPPPSTLVSSSPGPPA